MRQTVILDASVVLQWFHQENERIVSASHKLFEMIVAGKVDAHIPELLLLEITNILVKKKKISPNKAIQVVEALEQLPLKVHSLRFSDTQHILQLMYAHSLTAYDARYLQLAQQLESPLITQDSELLRASASSITLVDFLKE